MNGAAVDRPAGRREGLVRIVGYATLGGQRTETAMPNKREALLRFLEAHLFDDEVVLTDSDDQLIFRAVDGIDFYSRLDEFGIDLRALYRELRDAAVSAASPAEEDCEPWGDLYDSVGLSPGEVAMRQEAKRAARAARTLADVVELLADTYFDASFESADGRRSWAYFDRDDLSVVEQPADGSMGERVRLQRDAQVRHLGSGEDVHSFVLLDPPPAGTASPD